MLARNKKDAWLGPVPREIPGPTPGEKRIPVLIGVRSNACLETG